MTNKPTIKDCMEQAQIFASAWSRVGSGVFGTTMEHATAEKEELEAMLHAALAAPTQPVASDLDDSELEDLAHAANQEALSYGVSLDVFLRLAKTVRLRAATAPQPAAQALDSVRVFWQQHTQADALSMTMAELHADVELVIRAARGSAQAAPSNGALATLAQPVAWTLDAQRLTKASQDISTVLRVEGMDLEIGSRKLLKEAREAIDAAIAAQPPAQALDALKQVCTIAVSAAKTNSRDIADWREDMDRIAAIAAQKGTNDDHK